MAFLEWSAAVGIVLCIPLLIRAWRAELLRGDDPQFRATGVFPRLVRALRRDR
ncbi:MULTISPECIES: hypothetical protein [Agromyces]|uniref:Uncharacterized protein n=1 Tax=Agromyces kandeliae TaxID=2666141 RepID=A0A6L5R6S4_9MICO|nr:hypothetical protein [Agromyces kandeliae]MRX45088.1 hypothetical protein [Agromyces kandeliae]